MHDLDRSQLPIWTLEQFEQQGQEAELKAELLGSHPDEELFNGCTPREQLQKHFGIEVTPLLVRT